MKDTAEVAAGAGRMIRALGRRVAMENPEQLAHFADLIAAHDAAIATSVAGLRDAGHTDGAIGDALGITRQAVQQRWPRVERVVGAGARYRAK